MTVLAQTKNPVVSLFKGWNAFELIWLTVSTIAILSISFIWFDPTNPVQSTVSTISSIAGILCVVFAAKGKIATYYVGIIQAGTYAWVSFNYGLFGEAMLNAFFYFPMQFIGMFFWLRHRKNAAEAVNGEDVYAKRLTRKQWLIFVPIVLVAIVAYAFLLQAINAQQVRLDSAAVVLSVAAQFLMLFRYTEQWLVWIAVNILSVVLWFVTLVTQDGNDWALFVMWVAFLVNSVYGYVNWRKLSRPENNETVKVTT